ncbi:hypothetical protein KY284_023999 [Solanum tuberosum]|nr:hypothetical protein KY284_023999 [Solanum tuberosum]
MNKKLYDALMKQENDKVIQLCRELELGPLHVLTVHDDTVLQVAAYSKQTGLVLRLLKELEMRFPEFPVDALKHPNANQIDLRSHKYRLMLDVSKSQEKDGVAQAITKTAESPLILATKSGCTEIVDEILKTYPQAVEYVDSKGRNILHVAIKYRQMQIFDIVKKMGMPMRRLKRKVTHQGNFILHMVGVKHQDNEIADMRSPALLLQENLLLFESLYIHEIGIRSTYTLATPDPTCGITKGFVVVV